MKSLHGQLFPALVSPTSGGYMFECWNSQATSVYPLESRASCSAVRLICDQQAARGEVCTERTAAHQNDFITTTDGNARTQHSLHIKRRGAGGAAGGAGRPGAARGGRGK